MDILKSFLITIDTEGDDIWSKRSSAETRNASFLPRLQSVCEKFGLLTSNDSWYQPFLIEYLEDEIRNIGHLRPKLLLPIFEI